MAKCVHVITCILSLFLSWSRANPIVPFQVFPLTSEIQIVDSAHWTVEISLISDLYNFNRDLKLQLPCSTDIFWVKVNPADTQPSSKRNIWINNDGIGLITNKHFPKIKIGDTFYLCCSNLQPGGVKGQKVYLHLKARPYQSLMAHVISYIGMGGYSTVISYIRDNSPTIGEKNDTLNFRSSVIGKIVDAQNEPTSNIYCAHYPYTNVGFPVQPTLYKTDENGVFNIPSYVPAFSSVLRFTDQSESWVSSVAFGALDAQPDSTLYLAIKLDDYNQVKINNAYYRRFGRLKSFYPA